MSSIINILLVDDEHDVKFIFNMNFRKWERMGFINLNYCSNAEDALFYLEKNQNPPVEIVLSDINMPGLSGIDLLTKVKQKYNEVDVFMISAYGSDLYTNKSKTLGADDYFTKQVDSTNLKARIKELYSF
jgi:YesN/AraC family two-component response regulator